MFLKGKKNFTILTLLSIIQHLTSTVTRLLIEETTSLLEPQFS